MSEIIKKLRKDSLAERGCKNKINRKTKEEIDSLFKEKPGKYGTYLTDEGFIKESKDRGYPCVKFKYFAYIL